MENDKSSGSTVPPGSDPTLREGRSLPDVVTPLIHGAAFIPKLSKLQQAFSLAMQESHSYDYDQHARRSFRRIADLIWQSCGGSANKRTSDPNPQPASIQTKKDI